jgi:deoxycytidylate deaminase
VGDIMPSDLTIKRNFQKAKAASMLSDYPNHKVGAVMMLGNKVIAVGYNITKTHPIQKKYNIERGYDPDVKNNGQIHAEMMCLINTKYLDINWSRVSLYIYREHKDHSPAVAKPCPACEKAIQERGIGTVYYTTEGISYAKEEYRKQPKTRRKEGDS